MFAMPKIRGAIAAAMLALVSVAAMTPAHAIVVGGRWDPIYGAPFSGTDGTMWWSGQGEFFIKDSCVPTGPGTVLVTSQAGSCGAGNMYVQNTTIDLSLSQGGPAFATLTFGTTAEIFVARFVDGQLDVVLSDYFSPWADPTLTNPLFDPFGVSGYSFNLAFSFDGALLYHADEDGIPKHKHGHDDDEKFWNGNGNGHVATPCSALPGDEGDTLPCGFSDEFASVEFDSIPVIPEPQTYALMLLGLGAIALTTRRRRGAQLG